jgi:hypothetical protein
MRPDAVRPMTIGSPPIVPSPRTMAGNDFIQHEHVASEGRQADLSRPESGRCERSLRAQSSVAG